jgi:PAS domain S-box-containing protein
VQQIARVGSWHYQIADGRIFWSEELYRIFGLDPKTEPLTPELLYSLIHPDDREAFKAQVALHEPHRSQYRVVMPDGAVKHIQEEVRVVRDAQGQPLRMFGTAQDVTERAQVEERLRASERKYRTLFESSNDGILIVDFNGRLVDANPAAYTRLGYSREEFLALDIATLDTPEFAAKALDRFREIRERGAAMFDSAHRRKDGSAMPVEVNSRLLDYGGSTVFFSVIRDITERRRTEQALRQSERMLQTIIDAEPECVKLLDEEARLTFMNKAGLDMIQADSLDQVRGQCVCPMVTTEHRHVFQEITKRVFRGESGTIQFEMVGLKGRRLWLEMHAVPLRNENGETVALLSLTRDITERRLLEEERLRSQKLESIGTLAGGIAHDFNNLLQGIFGYLSMAKLSLDNREKALAMLEQAEKALHQSVNLTTQLLTFSKGGKPVRKPIDLRPVIENSVKFALSGSNVSLGLTIDEDLRPVEADEGQIGQVIQNIVMNAVQAMPLGGRLEISARNAPPARAAELALPAGTGLVEIRVHDQGVGIPAANLPRIFDPYFTTKEKGSGLGLATSYSIVRNHDGAIDVRSEMGKGSTVTVYLPASGTAREQPAATALLPARGSSRVLVMDDEEIVRTVAGELLLTLGHEAEFAADGAAAIALYTAAKAAGKPFDVVILDLTIRGGMGGEEAARRLREIDPAVRTVVSSGYSDNGVVASFRQRGFRAFLKKPYSIGELARVLEETLS